jgi:hypothetical protein
VRFEEIRCFRLTVYYKCVSLAIRKPKHVVNDKDEELLLTPETNTSPGKNKKGVSRGSYGGAKGKEISFHLRTIVEGVRSNKKPYTSLILAIAN